MKTKVSNKGYFPMAIWYDIDKHEPIFNFFFFCKILQWTNFLIFKNMLIRLRYVVHFQAAGKDCLFIKTFQTYQSQNWWNANRSNNRTSATDRVSTAMLIQSFLKFLELENEAKIWRRHRHVEISTIQIQVFHLSFLKRGSNCKKL